MLRAVAKFVGLVGMMGLAVIGVCVLVAAGLIVPYMMAGGR